MREFWNQRYAKDEFTYGTAPNAYLKDTLPLLEVGKALFPADGEGRNSVFAAELGWEVHAFDFSTRGKEKAEQLAASRNVEINYTVQRFLEEEYKPEEFDAICLTSVHFEAHIKSEMHRRLDSYLKVGGVIILEAYSKEHREINMINPAVGGPPDAGMMYSLEEIENDFTNYDMMELSKEIVEMNEGFGHVGESSVVRFLGRKIYSVPKA